VAAPKGEGRRIRNKSGERTIYKIVNAGNNIQSYY